MKLALTTLGIVSCSAGELTAEIASIVPAEIASIVPTIEWGRREDGSSNFLRSLKKRSRKYAADPNPNGSTVVGPVAQTPPGMIVSPPPPAAGEAPPMMMAPPMMSGPTMISSNQISYPFGINPYYPQALYYPPGYSAPFTPNYSTPSPPSSDQQTQSPGGSGGNSGGNGGGSGGNSGGNGGGSGGNSGGSGGGSGGNSGGNGSNMADDLNSSLMWLRYFLLPNMTSGNNTDLKNSPISIPINSSPTATSNSSSNTFVTISPKPIFNTPSSTTPTNSRLFAGQMDDTTNHLPQVQVPMDTTTQTTRTLSPSQDDINYLDIQY